MMVFRRRSLGNIIHSNKHIVDVSATLGAGINLPTVLVLGVDAPTLAVQNSVEVGSKVNGIFLNIQVVTNEVSAGAIPNVYMAVYKNANGTVPTLNPASMGNSAFKKLVFHQEMGMFEAINAEGNPRTLFKGVVVIPKGMRRMGQLDEIVMVIRSPSLDIKFCVQAIYKSYQ